MSDFARSNRLYKRQKSTSTMTDDITFFKVNKSIACGDTPRRAKSKSHMCMRETRRYESTIQSVLL